jgi:hypothetical protein
VENRPVCICDVCGYVWLVTSKQKRAGLPIRCPYRGCRSLAWNREQRKCNRCGKVLRSQQRNWCSAYCKGMVNVYRRRSQPVWRADSDSNGHHALCACIQCLVALANPGPKDLYASRRGTRYSEERVAAWRRGGAWQLDKRGKRSGNAQNGDIRGVQEQGARGVPGESQTSLG